MKTYKNTGAALADEGSNIATHMREVVRPTMSHNARVIEAWMATGLTREQAWAKALGTATQGP